MKVQEALLINLFMAWGISGSYTPEPSTSQSHPLISDSQGQCLGTRCSRGFLASTSPGSWGGTTLSPSKYTPPHMFLLSFVCFLRYKKCKNPRVPRRVFSRSPCFQPRAVWPSSGSERSFLLVWELSFLFYTPLLGCLPEAANAIHHGSPNLSTKSAQKPLLS